MLGGLMQRLVTTAWVRTRGRPFHRVTAYLAMAAAVLMLVAAWTPPPASYQPIGPNARGTVTESFNNAPAMFGKILTYLPPPLRQVLPMPSPSASPSGSPGASPSGSPSASPSESPSTSPTPSPTPSTSP
jgi:hypothetical protein